MHQLSIRGQAHLGEDLVPVGVHRFDAEGEPPPDFLGGVRPLPIKHRI